MAKVERSVRCRPMDDDVRIGANYVESTTHPSRRVGAHMSTGNTAKRPDNLGDADTADKDLPFVAELRETPTLGGPW